MQFLLIKVVSMLLEALSYSNNRAGPIDITEVDTDSTSHRGGVMFISDSSFRITNSTFTNNTAAQRGGVMVTVDSSFNITNSIFTNNSVGSFGGVVCMSGSSFDITSTTFASNSAVYGGGAVEVSNSSLNIAGSTFTDNSAVGGFGGAMDIYDSTVNIISSMFSNNTAFGGGGVVITSGSSFNIVSSSFYANKANYYGGIMITIECSIRITDGVFDHNLGSLYNFNSNLTFSGYTIFGNCTEPQNKTDIGSDFIQPRQEGGVITIFQSIVIFTGISRFINNQARRGGAILAIESTILVYGETTIANNTATVSSGGGIYLQQSDLEIEGNCIISGNNAVSGGGIHATSSTIAVHQQWTLLFINNKAEEYGGGLHLGINPKLYILKPQRSLYDDEYLLTFRDNYASFGGAIYVDDATNSGACSPDSECFFQALALYLDFPSHTGNILFSGNTASEQGANLFGGLLDRCIPSPFAEVYLKHGIAHFNGVSYLGNVSNVAAIDTLASLPVRVCFCNSESEPDCSYQPTTIKVKKGKTFTVPLVAVDQVKRPIEANIISALSSLDGGFSEGQQTQSVGRYCSNITFNVLTPHNSETINLFADGPCGSSTLSTRYLHIQFTECACPVGFQRRDIDERCVCDCDSRLSPHITNPNCNLTTESLVRVNTNSWITYTNDTDPPGYIIHPHCPFDFCQPQTENVSMNLNLPDGSDAQCAYNRSGVLCGACQNNLSRSLGSSRCIPCHSHWPVVLVVILLAAIIAGILLVTALLALNMTVAVGLINGFIFYANIVEANSSIYFPSSEPI